ncbi:MAG: large conductance mechanosensitive channel protein MscL [Hyphomonadaceae bacterium]
MFNEFKEFAMKGNLVDMAVGFVLGGAFATVVTAFIQGVFLPLLSPVMGGLDLSSMTWVVTPAVMEAGEVVTEAAIVDIGAFITALISFLIVALVMFMLIKGMNNMQKKAEEAPAEPPRQEVLLEEIRNLLAKSS